MKIRTGFVSNSSSSSFICDVSGKTYIGYDCGLEDAEMFECKEGHYFFDNYLVGSCDELHKEQVLRDYYYNKAKTKYEDSNSTFFYKLKPEEKEALVQEEKDLEPELSEDKIQELMDDDYIERYEIPSKYCPICTLTHIKDDTLIKFLLKELNQDREQVVNNIKGLYSTLEELEYSLK
jgi:hypothetical protein